MRSDHQPGNQRGNKPYSVSAQLYDTVGQYIDYQRIVTYLEEIFFYREITPARVLDLGCGTGEITVLLCQKGYEVTGLDLSSEMLAVARSKLSDQCKRNVRLIEESMVAYQGQGTHYDCVVSLSDCINHLIQNRDVQLTFGNVFSYLNEGGLFVFDINTPYEIEHVMSTRQSEVYGDIKYDWSGTFDKERQIGTFIQTFYRLSESGEQLMGREVHRERAYRPRDLRIWLKEAGFVDIDYYEDLTFRKPKREDVERVYFVARKPG